MVSLAQPEGKLSAVACLLTSPSPDWDWEKNMKNKIKKPMYQYKDNLTSEGERKKEKKEIQKPNKQNNKNPSTSDVEEITHHLHPAKQCPAGLWAIEDSNSPTPAFIAENLLPTPSLLFGAAEWETEKALMPFEHCSAKSLLWYQQCLTTNLNQHYLDCYEKSKIHPSLLLLLANCAHSD